MRATGTPENRDCQNPGHPGHLGHLETSDRQNLIQRPEPDNLDRWCPVGRAGPFRGSCGSLASTSKAARA